jgi:hypothetical protein
MATASTAALATVMAAAIAGAIYAQIGGGGVARASVAAYGVMGAKHLATGIELATTAPKVAVVLYLLIQSGKQR